jgi:RNA recognition motif-containing protein
MATLIKFLQMFEEDPIFAELASGKKCWGDILCETKPHKTITTTVTTTTTEVVDDSWEQVPKKNITTPKAVNTIKTVIARNLPRDISVDTLRGIFAKFGIIKDIYIPKNMDKSSPYYGTTKGFALIKFVSPTDSLAAYNSLYNNLTISKKMITIEFAKEDR